MGIFSAKEWLTVLKEDFKEDEQKPVKKHKDVKIQVKIQGISTTKDEKISRDEIPGSGDEVFSEKGGSYTLGERLGDGREGDVFKVNKAGRVAKIYHDDFCTTWTHEKLKLMVDARLNFNGICFPLEILKNSRGQFTGFIMQEAKGVKLTELLIPKTQFEMSFPECNKQDLVQLAISVLKKIRYLHENNVIMGDISPRNIMFVSSSEVYFIDADSYQYGPYPCRVGTSEFLAPELRGVKLRSQMRTEGNENFAVAVILFMLMMQGQHPYAHKRGTRSELIFPYGAGERTVPEGAWTVRPNGPWLEIWSHLPRKLKDAFIDSFRKDGNNNTEQTRFSVHKWLELMYAYNHSLPAMITEDPENGKVYPHGLKKVKS